MSDESSQMTETMLVTAPIVGDPLQHFTSALQVRKRNEFENQSYNGYKYKEIDRAPAHHQEVARLRAKDRSIEVICNLTGLKRAHVNRILAHPPVSAWVEMIQERVRLRCEEANAEKAEAAKLGFEYQKGVIDGSEKPNKVRLDAALDAQKKDPFGRFREYAPEQETRTPMTGEKLKDFIEASRAIEVACTVVND